MYSHLGKKGAILKGGAGQWNWDNLVFASTAYAGQCV